jgi:hypothetical protein
MVALSDIYRSQTASVAVDLARGGSGKLHSSFVGEDSSIIPGANSWRLGVWRQVADWFLSI